MMIYRQETQSIESALDRFPAVGLIGSRQCGKTTLAKDIASRRNEGAVYLDLELPSDLAALTEPELYLERHVDRLVVLDEIQRHPELFAALRGLIDRDRRPGRFLILGSASPDLLRQSSESLAGRISFVELTPFLLSEVVRADDDTRETTRRLWFRGGYPESYLSSDDAGSMVWRRAFITTLLERDMPQWGFRVSSVRMRRFWEMLAHVHGQEWNASRFANSLDTSAPTVRRHLDLLTDLLLVRQLQPLHANLKKRLVKSPKVYLRDSGLLHALLRLTDPESIYGHPCLGASFEGFAIENIINLLPSFADVTFYRSHTGDEIDLVVTLPGGRRIAVDVKYTATPRVSRAFRTAMTDLGITRGYIVTAGEAAFPLDERIEAVPLHLIADHIGSW